jgi:hypothetical protein
VHQGLLLCFAALFLFAGCAKAPEPAHPLEVLLTRLNAPPKEARLVSQVAHARTALLKTRYGVESSPRWHNALVNLGVKSRGLCWHYAHDLYTHLAPIAPSLDTIVVVAHLGSWWKEHSAVVLTCKGCSVQQGVVLDAWRDTKHLVYIRASEDSYPWRRR